jgi:hypothetical protein
LQDQRFNFDMFCFFNLTLGSDQPDDARKKKEQKEKELKELNEIFKPVISKQKIEAGVDPKSILCAFFKQGQCSKGDKCKFSHNLQVEHKSAKRDIFTDTRDAKDANNVPIPMEGGAEDGAETDGTNEGRLKNFHICNHFLDAVENNKYGWFWECPNGGDKCKYKHALPPGYQLKRDSRPSEDAREQSLEELLHWDKAKMNEVDPSKTEGTPLTLERFNEWQAKFIKEREKDKPKVKKSNKQTGREMFTFNPNLEAFGIGDEEGISIYDTIEISNKSRRDETDPSTETNLEIDENLFEADLDGLEDDLDELKV